MNRVVAVAAAAALLAACSPPNDHVLPGQVGTGRDGYRVTVTFDSVENLVPNSAVMLDDAAIGTVTDITFDDWKAKVSLSLDKGVRLPRNATFAVGQKTLLGAQYVEAQHPREPRGTLRAGAVLGPDQTGTYPATEQVLASVSLLLNNGGLSQISTIASELNTTLEGRVPQTRDLVVRLDELLGTLDRNRDDIVAALEELEKLTAIVVEEEDTIKASLDALGPGFAALEDERASLVEAVEEVGRLSSTTTTLIDAGREDLLANVDALRPILASLDKSAKDIPDALKFAATLPFPVMTTDEAVFGDYANLFATVDLSADALSRGFLGGASALPSMQSTDPLTGPLGPEAPDDPGADVDDSSPRAPAEAGGVRRPDSATDRGLCNVLGLLGGCR